MNAPAKTGLRVKSPVPSRYPAYRIVSEADELLATVPISASGDSGRLAQVMATAPELLTALKKAEHMLRLKGYTPSVLKTHGISTAISKAESAQ